MISYNHHSHDDDHGVWPGFVDALSTVLLIFIFVVVGFIASQLYLSSIIREKNSDLSHLENELLSANSFLANTNDKNTYLENKVKELTKTINKLANMADLEKTEKETAQSKNISLNESIKTLNAYVASLESELKKIKQSLDAQVTINDEHIKTIDYIKGENIKLNELRKMNEYRSDFFAKLSNVLSNNKNIKIVGDRFMFQSELLFDSASAQLTRNGIVQVAEVANAIKAIAAQIPADVPWILCVNGHTDRRIINNAQFKSNWHLAFARAMAVVDLLIANGVPANKLAVVSFGSNQPVSNGTTQGDYAMNRRIEFKIDSSQSVVANAVSTHQNDVNKNDVSKVVSSGYAQGNDRLLYMQNS